MKVKIVKEAETFLASLKPARKALLCKAYGQRNEAALLSRIKQGSLSVMELRQTLRVENI